eukprot:scaffold98879_cov30-Prasinocladus_malaysianus.AAC.1
MMILIIHGAEMIVIVLRLHTRIALIAYGINNTSRLAVYRNNTSMMPKKITECQKMTHSISVHASFVYEQSVRTNKAHSGARVWFPS